MNFMKIPRFFFKSFSEVSSTTPSRVRLIYTSPPNLSAEGVPKPPALSHLVNEKDNADASAWVERFNEISKKIPKELVELSFSRSSGPGGQNVNKVNTKATIRCSIYEKWIPRWALPALKKDPHFVESTQSLLVTSTVHRSQSQNVEECLQKLHSLIFSAASSAIQKAPSKEQTKKVEGLIKAEKTRRKTEKMKRSSVKQHRGARGWAFDF